MKYAEKQQHKNNGLYCIQRFRPVSPWYNSWRTTSPIAMSLLLQKRLELDKHGRCTISGIVGAVITGSKLTNHSVN